MGRNLQGSSFISISKTISFIILMKAQSWYSVRLMSAGTTVKWCTACSNSQIEVHLWIECGMSRLSHSLAGPLPHFQDFAVSRYNNSEAFNRLGQFHSNKIAWLHFWHFLSVTSVFQVQISAGGISFGNQNVLKLLVMLLKLYWILN